MRLAYLGTPRIAVEPLLALVDGGFDVAAVVSRADKRRGRGSEVSPSAVKVAATRLGIPVYHRVDDLLGLGIDLGVVVAFGQLIKPHVLTEVPMVNLHFSLLPRWRGAAPVERALLAGDEVTGVCLMQLEEGLDTGGVYRRAEVRIGDDTSAADLRAELTIVGARLLVDALSEGLGEPVPQLGDPTYAEKVQPEEMEIDWSEPPAYLHRLVRIGGAWTTFRGKRLLVHSAGLAGDQPGNTIDGEVVGGLRLRAVQPEGKARMEFADWARGARPSPGERLG